MEFLIGAAMVIMLLLFMGFSLAHIGALALLLLVAGVVLIGLFFLGCLALLFTSRKSRGEFSRVDDEARFKTALYLINGEELRNIFPYENMMKKQLYEKGKQAELYCCRIFKAVIDRGAFITIIIGSAVFIPAAVLSAVWLVNFLSGLRLVLEPTV